MTTFAKSVGGDIVTKPLYARMPRDEHGRLMGLTYTATVPPQRWRDESIRTTYVRHRDPPTRRRTFGRPVKDRSGTPRQRLSTLDPNTPWNALLVWFLAGFDLGPGIGLGYCHPDDAGRPTASSLTTTDGSWAEITLADDDGTHEVLEGGPRSVWRLVETAHETWTDLGRPGWERFGLTVTPDRQVVWFDTPSGTHQWPLADGLLS